MSSGSIIGVPPPHPPPPPPAYTINKKLVEINPPAVIGQKSHQRLHVRGKSRSICMSSGSIHVQYKPYTLNKKLVEISHMGINGAS